MVPDRKRLSPWLTVLASACVLLGAGLVAFDRIGEDGAAPVGVAPEPVATAPAPIRTPAVAIPANPPAADPPAADRPAADREPDRSRDSSPREPTVAVRPGAEVAIRSAPHGPVVAREDDETEFGSTTVFSVHRTRPGWLGVPTPKLPNGKLGWVRADPETVRGGFTEFRITVDLSDHVARLWKGEEQAREWTVTVGAPATATPTGRFSVTDLIEGGLNPAYGCCAVALTATQPNLPSGWSGGDRIAFHGTDGALGVDTSNGCIRSRDGDVRALVETVPLGTPVTIRP